MLQGMSFHFPSWFTVRQSSPYPMLLGSDGSQLCATILVCEVDHIHSPSTKMSEPPRKYRAPRKEVCYVVSACKVR